MDVFSGASHHDVLLLVLQFAVLLLFARVFGEIAKRLGQPTVVGEILSGIILGPSFVSGLIPAIGERIVPQTAVQGYLLEVVSLIGAMFLLLITGLETDLQLIRRHAKTAAAVSLGGILVTFSSGFLLGRLLPDFLVAQPGERLVFSLFIATAMAISAIPVIAKVLMDLNLMRRDIGQTTIAAGMSDDTIGWILLAIVAGLAGGQAITPGSVLQIVGSVFALMLVSFTVGRWLVKRLLDFVQDEVTSDFRLLSLVVIMMFFWGALTQALGLEAMLGAFVMGILFAQMPRLPRSVHHLLEGVTMGIFAPIFFAVAGLKVNAIRLLDPQLLGITLAVIVIATIGKMIGTYGGARLVGKDHWSALSFGAGLNARGAIGIIIATIGLDLEILNQEMFSILVIMSMVTSLIAPAALRWTLQRVEPDEQELARLRREELASGSMIENIRRALLPVRVRDEAPAPIQTTEACILEKLGRKRRFSVTLINVGQPEDLEKSRAYLTTLSKMFSYDEVLKKSVVAGDPADAILNELEKDYDLLVLGASEKLRGGEVLFTPMVDSLLRMASTPTMIVKAERVKPDWGPRKILAPTNGQPAAKNAVELAFALVTDGEAVTLLNVVQRAGSEYGLDVREEAVNRQIDVGRQIVEQQAALGESRGVQVHKRVEVGGEPENVILEMAREENFDLIILGTDVRLGSNRLFLGPRVDFILEHAPCPVIVMNS